MIRQLILIAFPAALAVPALRADRVERTQRPEAVLSQQARPAALPESVRALVRADVARRQSGQRSVADPQATLPMAPGVIQVNLYDSGGGEAYFTLTGFLPKNTKLEAFMIPPDSANFELGPQTFKLDTDFVAGDWVRLPSTKTMRQFGPPGLRNPLAVYYVVVTRPDGSQSWSRMDFSVKDYYRNRADTALMIPGIDFYRQFIQDGVPYVEIKGRFLANSPVSVVFENYVAPPEAVRIVDAATILVNMKAVQGFDTESMGMYLLTVGQDGWTDTYPFRYTPY